MVLYELLSQQSPFGDINPVFKRNHKIQAGQRPVLHMKETRTLIQLQDVMKLCWEQEPDKRPAMSKVIEWINTPEFERLRAEITLCNITSISSVCTCRILPEHEDALNDNLNDILTYIPNNLDMLDNDINFKSNEEDIYQFLPKLLKMGSIRGQGKVTLSVDDSDGEHGDTLDDYLYYSTLNEKFDPYTQIWICRPDGTKGGMSHIFTYNDRLPGNYVS